SMRRLIALTAMCIVLTAAAPAMAVDEYDNGNQIQIETPAYVSGELWVSNGEVHASVASEHCRYPMDWYRAAFTVDDSGAIIAINENAPHFNLIRDLVDYSTTPPTVDLTRFADLDMFDSGSCIQGAFVGRDDCSTEDLIGVLATSVVFDSRNTVSISTGNFDDHDIGNLYCLVVIERDPWLEIVRDSALVPEPIRATFPQFRTLVGLENSVWYDVAAGDDLTSGGFTVDIPTTGNSYRLTLNIWLSGIRVDIDGDGEWEFNKTCSGSDADTLTPCAGSAENPVYTFEYETRAFHPFTIQTLWAGRAVDPAGNVLNIDPGLLLNEHTFDWETVEVRSSLDG
ncbi:MAG: hypothetical protein ACN4GZ_17290, partial [Acidimicrobiales bacterium]